MRTDPETPAWTHYMFRGLIRGFEGFTQVIIARTIEVPMCKRGPARLYVGHEERTRSKKNPTTTWKHRIDGLDGREK